VNRLRRYDAFSWKSGQQLEWKRTSMCSLNMPKQWSLSTLQVKRNFQTFYEHVYWPVNRTTDRLLETASIHNTERTCTQYAAHYELTYFMPPHMSRCTDVCRVVRCQHGLVHRVGESTTHMQQRRHHMTAGGLKLSSPK